MFTIFLCKFSVQFMITDYIVWDSFGDFYDNPILCNFLEIPTHNNREYLQKSGLIFANPSFIYFIIIRLWTMYNQKKFEG